MHLDSLTLINVRQFEERTFKFQPGFNLLVGENGAGKTTILRGLIAALGNTRQSGRRLSLEDDDIRLRSQRAEVKAIIHSSNNRVEEFNFTKDLWKPSKRSSRGIKSPLSLIYSSNEAICSGMKTKIARRTGNVDPDPSRSSEEFLYSAEREYSQRAKVADKRVFGNSRSVRDFVGRVLSTFSRDMRNFYWQFEPYDCTLIPREGTEIKQLLDAEIRKKARASALRIFRQDWQSGKRRPFNWPDQAKVILTQDASRSSRDERELPSLRYILNEVEISQEDYRYILRNYSLEVKLAPRIMIQRNIGTLSLHQLSDGEQRLFSLFVDIARQLSINTPNEEFGEGEAVILIDEIDVHLHPKWQRRIVPALEDLFPNCQFISTTHSPFVIQATNRQKITSIDPSFLAISGGGNSIEDIAEDIQGVSVPQRSVRAEKLSIAAERYFTLLEIRAANPKRVPLAELMAAESSYRRATEPFSSDPAVHALLKVIKMKWRHE